MENLVTTTTVQSQTYIVNIGATAPKENNKKKGKKSEVYAFEIEDMKKIMNFFREEEMWMHYLIFVMSCNMARRIGDTLSLRWEHIFNPANGNFRKEILEIVEDKTDKLANPLINQAVRDAVNLYIEKTGVDPSENNYMNPVFIQVSGTHTGNVMTADGYRKALKKAAQAVGIEYNVGTHSARKTFGKWSRLLHPNDPNAMQLLQEIYNHSDEKTTSHYIGLTKEKVNQYYNDMGAFFNEYVVGDGEYVKELLRPTVTIDAKDIRELISMAYEAGMKNANGNDPMIHINAINALMELAEGKMK